MHVSQVTLRWFGYQYVVSTSVAMVTNTVQSKQKRKTRCCSQPLVPMASTMDQMQGNSFWFAFLQKTLVCLAIYLQNLNSGISNQNIGSDS